MKAVPGTLQNARRSCASLVRMAAGGLFALATLTVVASPYVPRDDTTILERVPARSDLERLAPLRAAAAASPPNLEASLALATAYIGIGRRNSDPRFIAYAQAALLPWLAQSQPPERALVLQAITLQYLHRFDAALTSLDQALERAPLDAQAWLTRAALLELRGDYAAARRACARLLRTADEFSALTCLTSVAGRNGQLAASYARLQTPGDLDPRLPAALRLWRLAVLAEMAGRLGDDRAAEEYLRESLRVEGDDPYVKAAYADLLLRNDRSREVLALLAGSEAQDPLLLRLAIAAHRLRSPQGDRWMKAYEERMRAAERDGDNTHQREQAMYLLEVRGDAVAALTSARRNWSVQREPADLCLYAQASLRAQAIADRALIGQWLATNHYEDRSCAALDEYRTPAEAP